MSTAFRTRVSGIRAAFAAALLLAPFSLPAPAAAQPAQPGVTMSLPGGPAGTEVVVRITGLAPNRAIQLGFGGLGSNHEVMAVDQSGADGTYTLTARIPDWVERHRTYHFFAQYVGQPPHLVSPHFIATADEGFVRVAGVLEKSSGCTLVRGRGDALYALHGEVGAFDSGARVLVEGTLDTGAPAPPATCGEEPTIPVRIRQVTPG